MGVSVWMLALKYVCNSWRCLGAFGSAGLKFWRKQAGAQHVHAHRSLQGSDSLKDAREGKGSYGAM